MNFCTFRMAIVQIVIIKSITCLANSQVSNPVTVVPATEYSVAPATAPVFNTKNGAVLTKSQGKEIDCHSVVSIFATDSVR